MAFQFHFYCVLCFFVILKMSTSVTIVETQDYPVYIGEGVFNACNQHLAQLVDSGVKLFTLVDEQTLEFCLPVAMEHMDAIRGTEILEIESGEAQKNPEMAIQLWRALSEHQADRSSVIINLGGGVISDLGGFVASTYKRGINFINLPTTLLGQVDASIGGKVGVDLDQLKNQVGTFTNPQAVYIYPGFLNTLPAKHVLSGFAEVIKHALISSSEYWQQLQQVDFMEFSNWDELIDTSVRIKHHIVSQDPRESGLRKVLNFGHTIGHALESYSLETPAHSLLHGEAVAAGMIVESYLSHKVGGLSEDILGSIVDYISRIYKPYEFDTMSVHRLIELMRNDKKNQGDQIHFTLLTDIGAAEIEKAIAPDLIIEALAFYQNLGVNTPA